MSLIPNQTNVNTNTYFFLEVNSKIINTSTINANTGTYNSLFTNNISTGNLFVNKISTQQLNASTISSFNLVGYNNYLDYIKNINIITNLLTLDNQGLTATPEGLYLNGQLVAQPGQLSSIDFWSRYPAVSDVRLSHSTLKDVLGISSLYLSTGLIRADTIRAIGGQIDTLFGFDQINYPKGQIEDFTACNITFSTIKGDTIYSKTINNEFEVSTYSVYAEQVNATVINNYYPNAVLNGNRIIANNIDLSNQIRTPGVSSVYISTNVLDAGTVVGNDGIFKNQIFVPAISTTYISSGFITTGYILAKGAIFEDMYSSTITADSLATRISRSQIGFVSSCGIDFLSSGRIRGTQASFSSIQVGNLSSGNIIVSSINSSNGVFDNLYTNNIYNTSNIRTSNLGATGLISASNVDVSGNLVVDGSTTLNGGTTINSDLTQNGNINFPTNNITSVEYPAGLAQFLKDINNLRNLNVEQINVLGGSTGNEFFPPYRNDSIINVGEDELSPGQVIINGFNTDPLDTGIALTVRGDAQIVQNANVLGILTAEGEFNVVGASQFEGEVNVAGLATFEDAIDVVGLATFEGAVNIIGGLGVEGATNLAGALTCEAGIGIVGALGLTAGDATFGSAVNTGNTLTSYYYTNVKNNMNVDSNLTVGGSLTANSIVINSTFTKYANISTLQVSSLNAFKGTFSNIDVSSIYTNYISAGTVQSGVIYNSSIITQEMIVANSNNAYITFKDTNFGDLGFLGRPEGQDNLIGLACVSTLLLQSGQQTLITGLEAVGLQAPNIVIDGKTSFNFKDIIQLNSFSTFTSYYGIPDSEDVSQFRRMYEWFSYSNTGALDWVPVASDWAYFQAKSNVQMGYKLIQDCSGILTDYIAGTSNPYIIVGADLIGSNHIIFGFNQIYTDQFFANTISTGSISVGNLATQSISSLNISTGSLSVSNIDSGSISTNNISTGNLFASGVNVSTINVLQNVSTTRIYTNALYGQNNSLNVGNTISPFNNASLGQSGFRFNQAWISTVSSIHTQTSTINAQTLVATSTLYADRLFASGGGTNIYTQNLFPLGGGSQLGFFGSLGTNSGGFYNNLSVRSTFTQVIAPDVVGAFSNNIRIQGNVSTQNVFVSSINNKLYPYTSTLNIPFSTFAITGTQATTPIVLYSNVQFPNQGFHRISQKVILSKNSGGTSQDLHANLFYTVGAFPSTPSITDGYSQLPYVNSDNRSTFTTCITEFYVSTPTTRNILYYDATGNNYTARLYMGTLFDTYTPDFGINPTRIPNIN